MHVSDETDWHAELSRHQLSEAQKEWGRCKHWIEAALARGPGFEDIEDVERLIADGDYVFFAGKNSAVVCSIEEYSRKKAFVIQHAGGDLDMPVDQMISELDPYMCAFARSAGCALIIERGREGWKKPLEKHGYRVGYVAMIKDLYV